MNLVVRFKYSNNYLSNMEKLVVFTLLALCVTSAFGKSMGPQSFHPNDVISFFRGDSFAATTDAPSTNCFTYYMPILNKISTDTQAANEACSQVSQKGLSDAATTADNAFKQINSESTDLQTILNSCTQQPSTSDGLNCYVTEGDENIPSLSSISNNARTAIREYNQQVEAVNATLETCNAEVSSESQAASQEVYAYLMTCMESGVTVAINPQITISTAVPTTVKVPATTELVTDAPTTVKVTETTGAVTEAKTDVTDVPAKI
ncbi:hypothetical protein ACFFRR_007514 [Megaselia abdita]